jgi:hypothetical protein
MNSCPEPLKGLLNPNWLNRRMSSRLDTGTSFLENGHRLRRHIYGVTVNRRDGMTQSLSQCNPAFNSPDQIISTILNDISHGYDTQET